MQSSTATSAPVAEVSPSWVKDSSAKLETELAAKYGDSQRAQIKRGLN
jgi:hypothetical protein